MPSLKLKHLTNTGDTIVEALIAIAVISFALTGAYVSASHSLKATQMAEERGEATAIAQSQTEVLNYVASLKSTDPLRQRLDIFNTSNPYCITDEYVGPGTDVVNYRKYTILAGVYGSCAFNNANMNSSPSPSYPYRVKVTYNNATPGVPNSQYFTVYVEWDGAGGQLQNITMYYKVYDAS